MLCHTIWPQARKLFPVHSVYQYSCRLKGLVSAEKSGFPVWELACIILPHFLYHLKPQWNPVYWLLIYTIFFRNSNLNILARSVRNSAACWDQSFGTTGRAVLAVPLVCQGRRSWRAPQHLGCYFKSWNPRDQGLQFVCSAQEQHKWKEFQSWTWRKNSLQV